MAPNMKEKPHKNIPHDENEGYDLLELQVNISCGKVPGILSHVFDMPLNKSGLA